MSTPLFRAPADDEIDERTERKPHPDAHHFRRDKSGMAKVRINLSPEEAVLIEEAADGTPLMLYIHRVLIDRAKFHIERQRAAIPES